MEEKASKRLLTESDGNEEQSPKRNYFHKKLRSESRRFSSLILSNSISISDHKFYFKIFLFNLEKPPHLRSHEDDNTIEKILSEEKMFPEFQGNRVILRKIAHNLKARELQGGQVLWGNRSKDEHFYKIVKGEVVIRSGGKNLTIKGKGEYIENGGEFKLIKDSEVCCKSSCLFLLLGREVYEWAVKVQMQNRALLQLMSKVSLFSKFKRKELTYLMESCREETYSHKHNLFLQNQSCNGVCYLLVQGELAIEKHRGGNKKQVLCLLNEGSLIGEESLFSEYPNRFYSVTVHSSHARVLEISSGRVQETIQHFELGAQLLSKKYIEFIREREEHYRAKMEETCEMRKLYRPSLSLAKMSPVKHQQMTDLLRNIENFSLSISKKEKYLEKRLQNGKTGLPEPRLISVDKPLFGRDDFPQLKLAKKYNIFESKAKQNCKFPHLI